VVLVVLVVDVVVSIDVMGCMYGLWMDLPIHLVRLFDSAWKLFGDYRWWDRLVVESIPSSILHEVRWFNSAWKSLIGRTNCAPTFHDSFLEKKIAVRHPRALCF